MKKINNFPVAKFSTKIQSLKIRTTGFYCIKTSLKNNYRHVKKKIKNKPMNIWDINII